MIILRGFGAVGEGVEPFTVQLAPRDLFCTHHPRDRRARLPISPPYSMGLDF